MGDFTSIQIGENSREVYEELEQKRSGNLMTDRFAADSGSSVTRIQYDGRGGASQPHTEGKVSAMDRPGAHADYSVIGTARNGWSRTPVAPHEVKDSDVVYVGGVETSVKVAASMGFIRPSAVGGYEDAGGSLGKPEATTVAPEDPDRGGEEVDMTERGGFEALEDVEARGILEEVTSVASTDDVHAAINEVVDQGGLSEKSIGRMAASMGITEEEAADKLERLNAGYTAQRNKVLEAEGIADEVADQFWHWAATMRAREGADALRKQFTNGNLDGFRGLAREFYRDALPATSPEVIVQAAEDSGMDAWVTREGRIILDIPGHGQLEYNSALNSGIIGTPRFQ
ncbi:hypothetical protein SAMN05421720_11743 [Rhodospira trueperi]|uniref:Uncharacterized protein n=2 Tax=Rhodospira trueperi TaxID=69960 RepID=A0A1G7H366_9PROT|nr:hypothetical protein SAMN05421720_11743 [Rhodospira trueperi]